MAKRKAEKVGFKDLVTFAKAGWTPEETNALLDRLEAMGDPTDAPEADDVDDADDADGNDQDDLDVDDVDGADGDDQDDSDEDDDQDNDEPSDDVSDNLSKMKKIGLEVENQRLKKEIKKLQAINNNKDVSSKKPTKSMEDSLIDAFQSCF